MKKIYFNGIFLLLNFTLLAQEVGSKKILPSNQEKIFRAHEWQLDSAVVGGAGIYRGKTGQGIGGDIGVNYFFTKYIGVGIEDSVGGHQIVGLPALTSAFDRLVGNLFIRYPIDSLHLAPYFIVGGGAYWDQALSLGHACVGGGCEYRFTPRFALFFDGRWLYGNYGNGTCSLTSSLPRIGVRWIF